MAEEQPANDVSSYSDPIYDVLERVNRSLAKNWRIIAIIILILVAGITYLLNSSTSTAEAVSATAYTEAAGDADKLKAVAADASILPAFRFRAANDLLKMALSDNKLDEAQQHLSAVEAQAKASGSDQLQMYALISKASLQSQAGEIEAAINTYTSAIQAGRKSNDQAANLLAQFNKAALQVTLANKIEDAEQAKTLREDAFFAFDNLRQDQELNNTSLQQASEYAYYDLLRKFPALNPDNEAEALSTEETPTE